MDAPDVVELSWLTCLQKTEFLFFKMEDRRVCSSFKGIAIQANVEVNLAVEHWTSSLSQFAQTVNLALANSCCGFSGVISGCCCRLFAPLTIIVTVFPSGNKSTCFHGALTSSGLPCVSDVLVQPRGRRCAVQLFQGLLHYLLFVGDILITWPADTEPPVMTMSLRTWSGVYLKPQIL